MNMLHDASLRAQFNTNLTSPVAAARSSISSPRPSASWTRRSSPTTTI